MDCSHQAPLSVGFFRQEYWSGLPFPSPGDLPNPGVEPGSPALQADALSSQPPGKPKRDLWHNIKHTNIRIIGVPEEEEKKGYEKIFEEIIVENFPNVKEETVNQVQEAQSPIQCKFKEKQAKTHTKLTNKD